MQQAFQFRWIWFLMSFSAGILYVYLVRPSVPMVVKYPTPINAGKIVYKDSSGKCYVYEVKPVACSPDAIEQNIVSM